MLSYPTADNDLTRVINPLSPIKIIAEMAGILFAILLALWVDEVRSDWKLKILEKESTLRIFDEISSNIKEIETSLAVNREIITEVSAAFESIDFKDGSQRKEHQFHYQFAEPRYTAWNTAQITGATSVMEVELLYDLSDIYSIQAMYTETVLQVNREIIAKMAIARSVASGKISDVSDYGKHKELLILMNTVIFGLGSLNDLSEQMLARYAAILKKHQNIDLSDHVAQ